MAKKTSGGQPANNNAGKNKPFHDAIRRALLRTDAKEKATELDLVARALIREAKGGSVPAIALIAERSDGKMPQAHEVTGEDGSPIEANLTFNVVFRSPNDAKQQGG